VTDDDEIELVWRALQQLSNEQDIWHKNLVMYRRMDRGPRIWWWRAAKKQAELGVPAMQTLLTRVITLRITS